MSRAHPGLLVAGIVSLLSALAAGCEHRPQPADGTNQPPGAGATPTPPADAGAGPKIEPGDIVRTTPGTGGTNPAPPPGPVPPPPPGSRFCFHGSEGDPTSCKPPELWKQYAAETCKAKGVELFQIDYAEPCGAGSYRFVKYSCCTPPPPPPPLPPADQCRADADCPLIRMPCKECPGGGPPSCPSSRCVNGQCQIVFSGCQGTSYDPCAGKKCGEPCRLCQPDDRACVETDVIKTCNFVGKCSAETSMCSTGATSCPAGFTWCFFSGRCVDDRCRTCCESKDAPPCKVAADCGPSCTKCSDGTTSCVEPTCGERAANQCFFHEPKCPGK